MMPGVCEKEYNACMNVCVRVCVRERVTLRLAPST